MCQNRLSYGVETGSIMVCTGFPALWNTVRASVHDDKRWRLVPEGGFVELKAHGGLLFNCHGRRIAALLVHRKFVYVIVEIDFALGALESSPGVFRVSVVDMTGNAFLAARLEGAVRPGMPSRFGNLQRSLALPRSFASQ